MNPKCEICGKTIAPQNMSKSYKHRCKKCVADITRESRKQSKSLKDDMLSCGAHIPAGAGAKTAVSLMSTEDRRRERIQIASAAMQGMIASATNYDAVFGIEGIAVNALKFADALLAEADKEEEGGSDE